MGIMKRVGLLLFPLFVLFILLIYRVTAAPTISWVDSGVIAAAANTLGIANPPGFPLYMIVAHLFTKIPWGSVVSRLQLLSQLSAVGLVLLVYIIVKKYGSCPSAGHPPLPSMFFSLPALFAAIAFAFSYGLWQQANNVETYTLTNVVLFGLIIWAITLGGKMDPRLRGDDKRVSRNDTLSILLLGFMSGLSMGLNPTISVLAGAAIFWLVTRWNLVRRNGWTFLLAGILFAAGVVIVYSYLPIRAATHPFVDWGDPVNWDRIRKHIFGAGLNIYEPETNSINGFTGQPKIFWESFLHYWHLAIFQFTPLLFPFVVVGVIQLRKRNQWVFGLLASILGMNLLYVVLYYGGNQESWMITSWVVMAVFLGVGVDKIYNYYNFYNNYKCYILTAFAVIPLFFWYPFLDHAKYSFPDEYAAILYKSVPPGSIIVGGGDFFNSLTAYTHEVTGLRKDVIPVTGNMFYIFDWYRNNLTVNTDIVISASTSSMIKYKSVDEFTDAVDSLIADNPKKQVFVTPLLLRDSVVAGTKEGNYHTKKYDLLPHGLLLKIVPKGSMEAPNEKFLDGVAFGKPPFYLERNYKNAYRLWRNDFGSAYQFLGDWWQQRGQMEKAYQAFTKSIDAGPPDSAEYIHRLAIFYAQVGQKDQAKTTFEKALAISPDDAIIKQNYQTFLGNTQASATPSAALAGDSIQYKGNGLSFRYPKDWIVTNAGPSVQLVNPEKTFRLTIQKAIRSAKTSVEEYINSQPGLPGKLTNQGLAKIPSFDVAYVRIWDENKTTTMQFFLFRSDVVVMVTASPGDSPLMRTFDAVVTSLAVE